MSDVIQVELPSGQVIWARIEVGRGPRDVALEDWAAIRPLENLVETVQGVVESLQQALRRVHPRTVTAEFGIEFSYRSGKVVSLLADGSATASIKLTLAWNPDQEAA